MEEILSKLLISDNATIKQGTVELKEALKRPESTPALCRLLTSSINPQIRQYAGVLLRKRYQKSKTWTKLPINIRSEVKAIILQGLVNEPEKSVKNSIAQLIGVIVKHEIGHNSWPELFQFIKQLVSSSNISEKELGMYTLSIMTEMTPEIYIAHLDSIGSLLIETYVSLSNFPNESVNPVAYYIIRIMSYLSPFIEKNQTMIKSYNEMLPLAMNTIQSLIVVNQDKAIEALELFEDLCSNAISIISGHLKNIIFLMLELAKNKNLNLDLRVKSVGVIAYLIRFKPRTLQKLKLNEPIIDVVFELISSKPDNENDEDYLLDENDESTPVTCATEILDLLALHMKPEKVVSHLLKHIESSLCGNNIYYKKASFLSMAFLAEGCSEYIRSKYLESFLRCICQGITDQSTVVKNSALFALGKFSENLQPEMSQYAKELLPVLFEYLGQVALQLKTETSKESIGVDRIFYALETFCENLNDDILPYLPTLMDKLFELLNTKNIRIVELSISAISAIANASKENLAPYFMKIISHLDIYLNNKQPEETMCLQIQSIDTLGVIARTIGDDNFNPFVNKTLDLGIKLINENDDPDLRKAVYGLFASLSLIMKKNIAPALPQIISYIFKSIQNSDGIIITEKDSDEAAFPIFEDLSDDDNNDEEDIENTDNEDDDYDDYGVNYDINNVFVEEKEEAIMALKEIALYTEEAFLPYLEKSFEEIFTMVNIQHEDIRSVSITALTQFCINFSHINTDEGREALLKALSIFIPKLSELIRLDNSPAVAISGLESLSELLKEIKSCVIYGEGHKEAIMNCIVEVFTGKLQCQEQDNDGGNDTGDGDDDDDEAEQEEYMIECAGDVLSNFGKAMSPEDFVHYFQTVFPYIRDRSKDSKSETKRSFAVGIISECLGGLKHTSAAFVSQLYPLFKKRINDTNPEVRNNAYYGIGELIFWGKDALYPYYNEVLLLLAQALQKEEAPGPRDNMVGVIARMIMTNYSLINIEQVFPGFVQQLPLRQDYEEYQSVFKSILVLYKDGHQVIKPHIRHLLKLAIDILYAKTVPNEETKFIITDFINSVQQDFPEDWNAVFATLSQDLQEILTV